MNKPTNGNKLPDYYDDPVDIFYKERIINIINPYFYKLGFTPNSITTISFFFGLLACYLYYKEYYVMCAIIYLISYFFDVMDGYFARIYNMKSKFGSYYDSISDNIVFLILILLFIFHKKISLKIKLIIIFFMFIYGYAAMYNMSCQEEYVKQTNKEYLSPGLDFVNILGKCKDYTMLKYTKFFGTGCVNIIISIIIFLHIFIKYF
jgi:phosphatidylglycerophosphate synthase